MSHTKKDLAVYMTPVHVVSKVTAWDQWGNTYEREYVGCLPSQAVSDLCQLVEFDGVEIRDIAVSSTTDCRYLSYEDMCEDNCCMTHND